MMKPFLGVLIKNRNFASVTPQRFGLVVESMTNDVMGGPKAADLTITGGKQALMAALRVIRSPIYIYDKTDYIWWGWAKNITVNIDGTMIGIDISSMYDRVKCVYTWVEAGNEGAGDKAETIWEQDEQSVIEYGIRETTIQLGEASADQAEQARDNHLAQVKVPQPFIGEGGGLAVNTGKITCAGWWETLGWQYYVNATDAYETIQEQVDYLVGTYGEFFNSIIWRAESSWLSNSKREGEHLCLDDAVELLKTGDDNGVRLLPYVDIYRNLIISPEPSKLVVQHTLDQQQNLFYQGRRVPPWKAKCGFWVHRKDLQNETFLDSLIGSPTPFFVESNSYTASNNTHRPMPKGLNDPYAIMGGFGR